MWPAQMKLYALKYRGHQKVFESEEYTIFLDKIGSDHYQDSRRNRHREVRKYGNKWQFNSSSGWTDYSPKIQAILNSGQESLQKRKRDDSPRLATNTGSNTIPDWWSALHQKIRGSDTYCYLRSRSAGPSIIDAYSSTEIYKNRNPNLEPSEIKFEESKYTSGEYNHFMSPTGNMLLVPPLDTGATDIKDFAYRYEIDEWNILYKEIMERWKSGIWVNTDGHAVKYLHIRFERIPLYNPSPDHNRL